MGDKDISQKQLEECEDVFADIVNVLLFDGAEVVDPDDLADAPTFSAYQDDDNEQIRKLERDVAKYWVSENVRLSYIGLENQTDIYKYMPLRVIGYDGTFYRNALNADKPEIIPVVTLVLYFGYKRRWKSPLSLKECLNIPANLKPYVSDYKMNLFEIAWLKDETIAKFKSDFRFVAKYLSSMRKTGKWQPMPEEVKHMLELFEVFHAFDAVQEYYRLLEKREEGNDKMPLALVNEIEQRGFERGIKIGRDDGVAIGIEQVATEMIKKSKPFEEIQEFTKLSLERIRQLAENLKIKYTSP